MILTTVIPDNHTDIQGNDSELSDAHRKGSLLFFVLHKASKQEKTALESSQKIRDVTVPLNREKEKSRTFATKVPIY